MTLSTARERFIEYKKANGRAADTLRTYNFALRRFVAFVIKETDRDVSLMFTADRVDQFVAHMDASGYTRKSISDVLVVLRQFSQWGFRKRIWASDVMLDVESVKAPKTLPRPFTLEELTRIQALDLSTHDRLLFGLLHYCGLRRKECAGLMCTDVLWPVGTDNAHVRVLGKGGVERVIPVAPEFWPLLRERVCSPAAVEGGPLLRDQYDSAMSTRAINIRVKKWGERAGVENCTPHRFRHFFATKMLNATDNLRVVQDLMGHASPTTTAIYTKVVSHQRQDAINKAFGTSGIDLHSNTSGTPEASVSAREDWEGYA